MANQPDSMSEFISSLPEHIFGPQPPISLELAPVDHETLLDTFGEKLQENIRAWASTKTTHHAPAPIDNGNLYRPLTEPYEIRVLEIHPGAQDEPLKASLRHCSVEFDPGYSLSLTDFTTPVPYTALSYAWGLPVFDAIIYCEGHVKAITRSLETALLRFRRTDQPVVMWIDQICIDQGNLKEREQQIPLMGKIYRHAFNTVIWLGESDPGSDLAIKLLEDTNVLLQLTAEDVGPHDFERYGLPGPESDVWQHVWDLLRRSWFTRLWIIQEVRLSRELWVSCGDTVTSWPKFSSGCFFLSTCGIVRWLQQKFGKSMSSKAALSDSWEAVLQMSLKTPLTASNGFREDESTLFTLLKETRYAECCDPRDKIYGLLGICRDFEREPVRVSYAPDFAVRQVYRDVVAQHIRKDSNGLRLTTVLTSVDHESPDLPSWVPDWRHPRRTISLGHSSSAQSFYQPNGRFKPAMGKIDVTFNNNNEDELRPRGIFVDTIVRLSNVFNGVDLTYINPATENHALLEFFNVASQLTDCPAPDTVFSAFLHTLVAGKDDTGKAKFPSTFSEIVSLLLDASTGQAPSLPGQTYSPRQRRPVGKGRLELSSLGSRTAGKAFQEVRTAMKNALEGRVVGITEKGYLGLFPVNAKAGDRVHVFDGCHVPFLLRKVSESGEFRLVGECYVYGIMEGEAVEGDVRMEEIVLV